MLGINAYAPSVSNQYTRFYNPYYDANYFTYQSTAGAGGYGLKFVFKINKSCDVLLQLRNVTLSFSSANSSYTEDLEASNIAYADRFTHRGHFNSGDTMTITTETSQNAGNETINIIVGSHDGLTKTSISGMLNGNW